MRMEDKMNTVRARERKKGLGNKMVVPWYIYIL